LHVFAQRPITRAFITGITMGKSVTKTKKAATPLALAVVDNALLSRIRKMSEAELATAINGGHQQIEVEIHTARQHASAALMGALQAGAFLMEVHRRFGKSGWGKWAEQHCPALPISTAYRYMDLSRKFPHVRTPEKISGLRQAYIAVGILPDAPAKKTQPPNLDSVPASTGTDLLARVRSLRAFYVTELEKFDYATLEPSVRRQLRQEITALLTQLNVFVERMDATPKPAKVVEISSISTRRK